MKKIILVVMMMVVFGGACHAYTFDKWTKEDTTHQLLFTGLTVMDWVQTNEIVRTERRENNPILGERPSHLQVNTLIPMGIVAHAFVSYLLPTNVKVLGCNLNPRRLWQCTFIVVEANAVNRNIKSGISISW